MMEVFWPPHWGTCYRGSRQIRPRTVGPQGPTVRPQKVNSWAEVNISTYPGTFGPWIIFFFLVQLYSKMLFLSPCRDITTMCRKIAIFGVHAKIFKEIFTSAVGPWKVGLPGPNSTVQAQFAKNLW